MKETTDNWISKFDLLEKIFAIKVRFRFQSNFQSRGGRLIDAQFIFFGIIFIKKEKSNFEILCAGYIKTLINPRSIAH